MRRYKLDCDVPMITDSQGYWITFEDAQSEITRLKNKIKTLETSRDYFRQQLNKERSLSGDVK